MSEAGFIKDKHYQFLLKYFPANTIFKRFKALWADTVKVVESYGLEKSSVLMKAVFKMLLLTILQILPDSRIFKT
jgi:hypothetical protein